MKKILYSLTAFGLMAVMASCQNEDEPNIPNPSGVQVTADFPEGSVVKEVNLKIADESRTRAESDNSFPLWNLTAARGDANTNLSLSYGVYYSNGTLFYSKDTEAFIYNSGSKTTVSIPLPAGETSAKVFLWVSKGWDTGDRPVNIDWDKKSVTMNYKNTPGCLGANLDGFCAYLDDLDIDSENSSYNVILKRPFTQVNIITGELYGPEDHAAQNRCANFLDGKNQMASDFGLLESADDRSIYVPETWYWEDDTFDMVQYARDGDQMNNKVYYDTTPDALNKTYDAELKKLRLSGQDNYIATFHGKPKRYIGVFYILSPRTAAKWKDNKTSKVFNSCVFRVYNSISSVPTKRIDCSFDYDYAKANNRWIIADKDDNADQEGTGIFSNHKDFKVSVQEDFDGEDFTLQAGSMSDQQ